MVVAGEPDPVITRKELADTDVVALWQAEPPDRRWPSVSLIRRVGLGLAGVIGFAAFAGLALGLMLSLLFVLE
jgi:hypothetical protein